MVLYKVFFTNEALKNYEKIPKNWQLRILRVLQHIKGNPYIGKKLKGDLAESYSYRVWPYRIIYELNKREFIVFILDIRHRQSAYN